MTNTRSTPSVNSPPSPVAPGIQAMSRLTHTHTASLQCWLPTDSVCCAGCCPYTATQIPN